MTNNPSSSEPSALFSDAEWYDRWINWPARLAREIPVLKDVLGPPGDGRILDAGCGTGRQALALAEQGYRVVGADLNNEMLAVARRRGQGVDAPAEFVECAYADLAAKVGGGFDGLFCLANALAAAGSRDGVAEAIACFADCLRVGGRLFVQVLNFPKMRAEVPCVRGPRVATVDGREYLSVRHFHFSGEIVQITNVTMWNDGGWKQRARCGTLYPLTLDEVSQWCNASGLRVDDVWGSYAGEAFDPDRSIDLILVATKC